MHPSIQFASSEYLPEGNAGLRVAESINGIGEIDSITQAMDEESGSITFSLKLRGRFYMSTNEAKNQFPKVEELNVLFDGLNKSAGYLEKEIKVLFAKCIGSSYFYLFFTCFLLLLLEYCHTSTYFPDQTRVRSKLSKVLACRRWPILAALDSQCCFNIVQSPKLPITKQQCTVVGGCNMFFLS